MRGLRPLVVFHGKPISDVGDWLRISDEYTVTVPEATVERWPPASAVTGQVEVNATYTVGDFIGSG